MLENVVLENVVLENAVARIDVVSQFLSENNFGDTREGSLAGPTGLVIILLLAIGTIFLIRNMNGRLKRLPTSFDNEPPTKEPVEAIPDQRDVDQT